MPRNRQSLAASFSGMKTEYQAMSSSRFRRQRPGVSAMGGSADRHAYSEGRFLEMREYVRAMDRDDFLIGPLTDRAVENQVQGGFTIEFQTGDKQLNKDLWQYFDAWRRDADLCDTAGTHDFLEMERLVARSEIIDGDILPMPITDPGDSSHGTLQLIEADLCRTPLNTTKNVVHGVQLDGRRRRMQYYFMKENIDPSRPLRLVGDTYQVNAYDEDGNPQVFQVYKPSRCSLTRGVTAFKAVVDMCGMIEDTNFATIVKQQIAACAVWSWEKEGAYSSAMQMGELEERELADFTRATEEGVSPGQMFKPPQGMKLKVQNANIPGEQYLPHIKFLLMCVGMQLGMPLILTLLDASETNFSGWRGAVDAARTGFRTNQLRRISQFYTPVTRWKVRDFLDANPAVQRAVARNSKINPFSHRWNAPGWQYIQPEVDAKTDAFCMNNLLKSPRRIADKNGDDIDDIIGETVSDNTKLIIKSIKAAQFVKKRTGVDVHWRDVANRDMPKGGQAIDTIELANTAGGEPMPAKKTA